MFTLLKGVLGAVAWLAACSAGAETFVVTFQEIKDPPTFAVGDPFPKLPLTVGTVTFPIPPGERVVAAKISGFWGSNGYAFGTAGVDVLVDGILVQQCIKLTECWENGTGPRPWSYVFADSELGVLKDGVATMTAVQTSEQTVQLGLSTLIVETAPVPTVPALSMLALLSLMAGLAAAGALALRRATR